jgi:hypothetical protein
MHTKIKENRPRLNEEFKQRQNENTRSRINSLPKNRLSMRDYSMSKIVLPKIRDKGIVKPDKFGTLSNKATINKNQLPTLNNYAKSTQEIQAKERYASLAPV